jgi:hypothetical protein
MSPKKENSDTDGKRRQKSMSPKRENSDTDGKDDKSDRKDDPAVVDSGVGTPLGRSRSRYSKSTSITERSRSVGAKSKERRVLKSNKGGRDGMLARAASVSVFVT